jgi:hypothetical protein
VCQAGGARDGRSETFENGVSLGVLKDTAAVEKAEGPNEAVREAVASFRLAPIWRAHGCSQLEGAETE